MARWKIPDSSGFSVLINFIRQTGQETDANTSSISGLQEDVQGLASQTTETFGEVDAALATMDSNKQDKINAVDVTIPITGWATDTSVEGYTEYYDLAVSDVTANDRASVSIAPTSLQTAKSCGICPTCETLAGKIRIRAAQVPSAAIAAQYWIETGKE